MAANGSHVAFVPENVLAAVVTMRSGDRGKKKIAMDFLDKFQKSKDAWATTIGILQTGTEAEALLFAAQTLKGKITFDLATQVPQSDWTALRAQLLLLLKKFASGPRPVRVQLCVCLANLAIQMTEWKDVLSVVVASLGNNVESHACILDFLRILPEEVTEGRKINLSEDELTLRTAELLADNVQEVVQLLINYAQSSGEAARNPLLLECITSWLREVPVGAIVNSPLLDIVVNALGSDSSMQAAAECLGLICRETREVDENLEVIQILLPHIVAQRPRIAKAVGDEDIDAYKAITRLFADAGDSWVVIIAREPRAFRPIVEALLECTARDKERDVIQYTFDFWYELKLYLVMERYIESRMEFADIYSQLVDILIALLQYPEAENGNEADLFDGDREQEEKFREFRHSMGDTLKDACEVMGVAACLTKVLDAIKTWTVKFGSQATANKVPNWQALEAILFAMRAMGRMVDKEENVVLPQLIPLLVQIPHHEKLRFAAIMVFGRYTEWTAEHPEFLQPQFEYIISSFQTDSKEIVQAAAQSIKYFCTDCKLLLTEQVVQLQVFYDSILDKLPDASKDEMTEGVATVVACQKPQDMHRLLKLYCDPLMKRIMDLANAAGSDEEGKLAVADHVKLVSYFVQIVIPYVNHGEENPAVKYWQEVFPVLSTILENFLSCTPICERICRCWRAMLISYRTAMTPLLGDMANKLAHGFAASQQGCFLWTTGAILREFSEHREYVDENTTESIYAFFESQTTNVLRVMSDLPAAELPDVIEDFFRLLVDALLYYPAKLITSSLFTPIFQAAISALALEQRDPLSATLHYIRDLLTYGTPNPAQSGPALPGPVASQLQQTVKQLLGAHGGVLIKQVMTGMMITFPRDCFADGSGVLLAMFELLPTETSAWVDQTIRMLPAGTITDLDATRLMTRIKEKLQSNDSGNMRQVRALLQDFTNTYRRRYVAPREGLGGLEAAKFHFEG